MAWADRVLHLDERELLEELIIEFALPEDLAGEAREILASPPLLSAEDFSDCTPEMRTYFLTMAQQVAQADGAVDPLESQMVRRLAGWLGVALGA